MKPSEEPVYLTERQLATRWAISPATLRAWRCRQSGGPPFQKFGGAIRYALPEIERIESTAPRSASTSPAALPTQKGKRAQQLVLADDAGRVNRTENNS